MMGGSGQGQQQQQQQQHLPAGEFVRHHTTSPRLVCIGEISLVLPDSVAQQNPESRVWLVMSSGYLKEDSVARSLLQQYPNIHPVTADPITTLATTPLLPIVTSQAWRNNTKWPEVNLSDLLRLGLVWEFGGVYLDTDVVCLRSLNTLVNTLAWQDRHTLGSGAFHFTPRHPVMARIMHHARKTFKSDRWGASGPEAFTSAVQEHCGRKLKPGSLVQNCPNVTVLPITTFYPVPATVWKTIFTKQQPRDVAQRFPKAYLLHTWRSLSRAQPITKGTGSVYDQAAAQFYPITTTTTTFTPYTTPTTTTTTTITTTTATTTTTAATIEGVTSLVLFLSDSVTTLTTTHKMNIKMILMCVLAVLMSVCFRDAASQVITAERRFPGERRLGKTNYGTHSFGKRGYSNEPISRHERRRG
ncbi:hypothetical protein Pmani_013675 [Petrolisthes manimaculis]|uniref:Alpha 1,4-glycosyltransferase domain-containing protein n=1 Tax=Petrolisthes manimaculis TaxID=1843537 RepID=A0AAE1UBY2_9EUCA|nr:hypothetical protein Pmani_013675 [Petrolisthes manimaculis]